MSGETYVKTSDIKSAVGGHEEAVLDAVVPQWRSTETHIDCPYPDHGGASDWRWDKKRLRAICTCCNGHSDSIFNVVQKCEGIDFDAAKVRVAELIGRRDLIKEKRTSSSDGIKHQKTDAASLLRPPNDNRDDELVRAYLAHRLGIVATDVVMPISRYVGFKELPYYDPPSSRNAKPKVVASPPCAVFETWNAQNKRHAHRIWLAPDGAGKADLGERNGRKREVKKSAKVLDDESTAGRSVFWGSPRKAPWIIITEGIETGAAVAYAFRQEIEEGALCVAAAISAAGVMAFLPWEPTRRITIAADRDEAQKPGRPDSGSKAGERAARRLCLRLFGDIQMSIALPGHPGESIDWLDIPGRDRTSAARYSMFAAAPFTCPMANCSPRRDAQDRSAILAEIAETYPLPRLKTMQLGYDFTEDGDVFIHKTVEGKKSGDLAFIPVASPFGVVSRLRRVDEADAYGLRVHVQDMDGQCRKVEFGRGDLAKQGGSEVRSALLSAGLRTEGDGDAVVIACLKAAKPSREIAIIQQPSWHDVGDDQPRMFITPGGEIIGSPEGSAFELSEGSKLAPEAARGGTFEGWRQAVDAALSPIGCEHWGIGILAGFAGAIVSLAGLDTCGMNLSGQSSAGKSTAQRLAVSVWSTPDVTKRGLFQSAKATDNSVEAQAARADGTILSLDELAHMDGKMVGKIIYTIAGGTGKQRMKADASLRANRHWNTFTLLSAECSLEEKITSGGGEWMAGMAVRIPDIDVTGINRNVDSETILRIDGINRHFGHAGPAFIRALITAGLHEQPNNIRDAIHKKASEIAGPEKDAGIRRAAIPFAILVVAGALAQETRIIPESLNVDHVVSWAWLRFRVSSDANVLTPDETTVLRIRTWIAERWNVTIRGIDAETGSREALGWYDGEAVYLPRERLREAAGNSLKERAIAKILHDLGHIKKRKDHERYTVSFIPRIGNIVAYALDRATFGRTIKTHDFTVHDGGRDFG